MTWTSDDTLYGGELRNKSSRLSKSTLTFSLCSLNMPTQKDILEKRAEPRLLCADLVDLEWKDEAGRARKVRANLEDISASGACIQLELPIPPLTLVTIAYPTGEFIGKVRYCVYEEIGYFLGVEFEPGYRWTQRKFTPQHLLDPSSLVNRSPNRTLKKIFTDSPQ
jgi:hypothetical protein